MPTIHPSLQSRYDRLERVTATLLTRIAAHTPAQQRFRPDDRAWNMLQVAEHLLSAEAGINQGLQKRPPAQATRRLTWRNHWNTFWLQVFLRLPLKFAAPRVLPPPQGAQSIDDIRAAWRTERETLYCTLADVPRDKLAFYAFKHPYTGGMDLAGMLDFMTNHVRHHLIQLKRIERHPQFPQA